MFTITSSKGFYIKMGKIKTEDMDDKKPFLGEFTQKEFYDALHFLRSHGGHK